MPTSPFRIGTRGSALALWQAETVRELLSASPRRTASELVIIRPEGDRDKHSSLRQIGGRGVFTSALQLQLLAHRIDLAVHSTKDLPSLAPDGVRITAYPQREDPRDALISRHGVGLADLPMYPVIGTSSRRRSAQILALRPDAVIHDLRGNIDTRLRKGASDEYDAVILAAAGLRRMGWDDRITEVLSLEQSCPAPGQGALAIETRIAPDAAEDAVTDLDNADIRLAVETERWFLRGVGGGCSTPIGAHARVERQHGTITVRFWGMLGTEDGSRLERMYAEWAGEEARERAFAEAERLLQSLRSRYACARPTADLGGVRVLVAGVADTAARMADGLIAAGADASALAAIETVSVPVVIPAADWVTITSRHAFERLDVHALPGRIAVVGEGTAEALRAAGREPDLIGPGPGAAGLVREMVEQGIDRQRVVCLQSDIARPELVDGLRRAGAIVTPLVTYRTKPVALMPDPLREEVASGGIGAVVFTSPSAVEAFAGLVGTDLPALSGAAMFAIGPATAQALRDRGWPVHGAAAKSAPSAVISALAHWFGRDRQG